MTDIILPAPTVQTKIRAFRIQIDSPYLGDKRIDFPTEALLIDADGKPVAKGPNPAWVSRNLSNVVTETVTIDDPVTGQSVTISVAGIATAIEAKFVQWYTEDNTPQPPVEAPAG